MPIVQSDNAMHWKRFDTRQSLLRWFAGTVVLVLFFISWRAISANTL